MHIQLVDGRAARLHEDQSPYCAIIDSNLVSLPYQQFQGKILLLVITVGYHRKDTLLEFAQWGAQILVPCAIYCNPREKLCGVTRDTHCYSNTNKFIY